MFSPSTDYMASLHAHIHTLWNLKIIQNIQFQKDIFMSVIQYISYVQNTLAYTDVFTFVKPIH